MNRPATPASRRIRADNMYTVFSDGLPVAQAEAISQSEANRLWRDYNKAPVITSRLSTPRECRLLAHLPLLTRNDQQGDLDRDSAAGEPGLFDDGDELPAPAVAAALMAVSAEVAREVAANSAELKVQAIHASRVNAGASGQGLEDIDNILAAQAAETAEAARQEVAEDAGARCEPSDSAPQDWREGDGSVAAMAAAASAPEQAGAAPATQLWPYRHPPLPVGAIDDEFEVYGAGRAGVAAGAGHEDLNAYIEAASIRWESSGHSEDEISGRIELFWDGVKDGRQVRDQQAAANKPKKPSSAVAAKYRDPNTGSTWTGRGLRPRWLAVALDAGQSLEEFLINPETTAKEPS